MNIVSIATKSLRYFGLTNLTIALGVAAATAVLTGALIVGDSMRHSLRELTLDRLGKIDVMLVSDGFFRTKLAVEAASTEAFGESFESAVPLILFPGGTVETRSSKSSRSDDPSTADQESPVRPNIRRAGQVTVLGIDGRFDSLSLPVSAASNSAAESLLLEPDSETAIVNQALADDLQITAASVAAGEAIITVRVPKQTQLPADSALGRKTDLIESLVDLKVKRIVPNQGLGRFSLFPSQANPLNVFVPIGLLQQSLSRSVLKHKADKDQANVILFSGTPGELPSLESGEQLRREIRPQLDDYGLNLKRVQQFEGTGDTKKLIFEYWSLSSDKLVLTDETVASIGRAFPTARPVFTYLANDIRKPAEPSGIPFSMVAGIDFDDQFRLISSQSQPIAPLKENEIVLNQWAAADLQVKVGDTIDVSFFEPETTHGAQVEQTSQFVLAGIAKLAEPATAFEFSRRTGLVSPTYEETPTLANDPDLTPEVPGVTDAETIDDWDLPFSTAGKLRSQDDEYWETHRTTPKGFVNLKAARKLWHSRFGATTNFRIPVSAGTADQIRSRLLNQFVEDRADLGMHLVAIKRRGLEASSGSTPFDVLFLALSMFVIGSALILVSLLFRLGLQQRAAEVGLMKAIGFSNTSLRRVWLMEMLLVSLLGAVVGVGLGVGYAAVMIQGLSTWWVGAISRPFLTMHLTGLSLVIGLASGLMICIVTIWFSLRRAAQQPVVRLLQGELESEPSQLGTSRPARRWLDLGLLVLAIGLALGATQMSGEAQAGSFMGAGFLVLVVGLIWVYRWLKQPGNPDEANHLTLSKLALLSAKRNPLRSTLTIGLVAVASFLIVAVSAFRLKPTDEGTAGFDWVAQSSQPIFEDLGTAAGQEKLLGENHPLAPGTTVLSLRFKTGEDASCNNLYQSTQPRALGLPPRFIEHFAPSDQTDFAWAGSLAETPAAQANPWELLTGTQTHSGTANDPIPVVLDKNTANYSLKIYSLGTVKQIEYDSGETIHVKVVGFLANTILQGSLIMSENDFVAAFPSVAGYQYFLIDDAAEDSLTGADTNQLIDAASGTVDSDAIAMLEDRLGDQGFDARSASAMLANFMSVQNTYLSTFQTLGALGLLLGTFGLAAVQIRSVLERKQELGLLRAVGFKLPQLSRMVMLENIWLLSLGLLVGVGAAMFTTIPHWLTGTASVPWLSLVIIFAVIAGVGLLAGWIASRGISRVPLLESLRG